MNLILILLYRFILISSTKQEVTESYNLLSWKTQYRCQQQPGDNYKQYFELKAHEQEINFPPLRFTPQQYSFSELKYNVPWFLTSRQINYFVKKQEDYGFCQELTSHMEFEENICQEKYPHILSMRVLMPSKKNPDANILQSAQQMNYMQYERFAKIEHVDIQLFTEKELQSLTGHKFEPEFYVEDQGELKFKVILTVMQRYETTLRFWVESHGKCIHQFQRKIQIGGQLYQILQDLSQSGKINNQIEPNNILMKIDKHSGEPQLYLANWHLDSQNEFASIPNFLNIFFNPVIMLISNKDPNQRKIVRKIVSSHALDAFQISRIFQYVLLVDIKFYSMKLDNLHYTYEDLIAEQPENLFKNQLQNQFYKNIVLQNQVEKFLKEYNNKNFTFAREIFRNIKQTIQKNRKYNEIADNIIEFLMQAQIPQFYSQKHSQNFGGGLYEKYLLEIQDKFQIDNKKIAHIDVKKQKEHEDIQNYYDRQDKKDGKYLIKKYYLECKIRIMIHEAQGEIPLFKRRKNQSIDFQILYQENNSTIFKNFHFSHPMILKDFLFNQFSKKFHYLFKQIIQYEFLKMPQLLRFRLIQFLLSFQLFIKCNMTGG